MKNPTVDDIDALLPQTQCRECGYTGCRPYAEALSEGKTSPNLCPPGGLTTLSKLGALLSHDISPYLTEFTERKPSVARIIEEDCIGCTKCIQACPVDAIIGSAKWMHTVITTECTGCGLCVPPCPVDCIALDALPAPTFSAPVARTRFENRNARLARIQDARRAKKLSATDSEKAHLQEYIQAALLRSDKKRPPQ